MFLLEYNIFRKYLYNAGKDVNEPSRVGSRAETQSSSLAQVKWNELFLSSSRAKQKLDEKKRLDLSFRLQL